MSRTGFSLTAHNINFFRKGRFGMSKLSRRILAMLLAFTMMASMGISALAVDTDETTSTTSAAADSTQEPDTSTDTGTDLTGTTSDSTDADTADDTSTVDGTDSSDGTGTDTTDSASDSTGTDTSSTTSEDTGSDTTTTSADDALTSSNLSLRDDTDDDIMLLDGSSTYAATTIAVGESKRLNGEGSWYGYDHSWSSSNPNVASVSGNGSTATVTGVSQGSVTITHTYKYYHHSKEHLATETFTVTVTGSSSSGTTYGYFYVRIPGTEGNTSIHYTEAWIYAGRKDIGSNPSSNESTILKTIPTTLEGVQTGNTLGFPYPNIEIDGTTYTYNDDLNASNTYKIVWDELVWSNGANWPSYNKNNGGTMPDYSADSTYIVRSGDSKNCWHINGHIETIGPIATVKFQVEDDPEKGDWTVSTEYYRATSKVSTIVRPSNTDVPDEKTDSNGMTYKFDGWYTDNTYTTKIDTINSEEIGETGRVFYGRYVPKYTVTYVYMNAVGNGSAYYKQYGWNTSNDVPLPKGPDGKIDGSDAFFAGWYHQSGDTWGTTAVSSNISNSQNQSAQKVTWVADTSGGTNMTLYAVYYQDSVDSYRRMKGTNGSYSLAAAENIADVVDGYVNELLFSEAYVTATGTNNQFVVVSEFFGDITDSGSLTDYNGVGFVISTAATDISTNPTTQGGYQTIVLGHVFRDKVVLNGVDYTPTASSEPKVGEHRHFIARVIHVNASSVSESDLNVTPFALDGNNAYIYGNGEKN